MLVYIVTEGEYSDYHIERVFDNFEDARKYYNTIKENKYALPSIETWSVGWVTEPKDIHLYWVEYSRKRDEFATFEETDTDSYEVHSDRWKIDGYLVTAKDEAHALKIAQDRHAEWKAMQEGIA